MKNNEDHSNKEAWDAQQKALFEQLETPFNQNMENTWETLLAKTYDTPKENQPKEVLRSARIISPIWFRIAAATILLAVCTLSFAKFHTTNITCLRGEHLVHNLPDGSIIQLNAESSIRYAPYWWYFTRSVQLEGEAFFEVEKGSRFAVVSKLGTTEVLGTSFNIYARKDQYRVLCTTGKVKVTAHKSKHSLTLLPNELATLVDLKRLEKNKTAETTNIVAWKKNMFYFNTIPLAVIFDEIERQYAIKIDYQFTSNNVNKFTGSFEKRNDAEQVLQIVTFPFGFKVKKINPNYYKIEIQ
jgi:ferric-dicitrate binding protein FerR (iron transport regulator)